MEASNRTRGRLWALVREKPGANTRQLARRIGMSETNVDYHLRKMERDAVLLSQLVGRDRCWYAAHCGLCPVLRRLIPILQRPGIRDVARALTDTPRTARAIADAAGVTIGSARWAGRELGSALIAERSQSGRLRLRGGAAVCLAAAESGARCDRWGRCPVSAAWMERRDAIAGVTASRSPSAAGSSRDHGGDPPLAPSQEGSGWGSRAVDPLAKGVPVKPSAAWSRLRASR